MRKLFLKIGLLFVVLIGGAAILFVMFFSSSDGKELILYGNVDVRLVDISFRVAGKVEEVCFEEGDFVERGALLARLDQTPYNSKVEMAAANLGRVFVSLKNAETLFHRRQELIGVGGVSVEDLDNAKSSFDQLFANWIQAKAELKVEEDYLKYTEVFAPTDGVILTRVREPGSVVNPSEPILTLSIVSPVWVRAYVNEKELGKIAYGMKAEVVTDTKGAPHYEGKIGFISPIAEFTPKTVETADLRTDLVYRVRIYVDNPDWRLKQGMPVTVRLKT